MTLYRMQRLGQRRVHLRRSGYLQTLCGVSTTQFVFQELGRHEGPWNNIGEMCQACRRVEREALSQEEKP